MDKGEHPEFCFNSIEPTMTPIRKIIKTEQLIMKHLNSPPFEVKEYSLILLNMLAEEDVALKKDLFNNVSAPIILISYDSLLLK